MLLTLSLMKPKQDLTYYHDINFEWLAAYLQSRLDVSLYKMRIQPIGIFSRNVNHDVQSIEIIDVDGIDTLRFKINRDGIYDNLPHGLFHNSLTTRSLTDTIDDVKESIKIENAKEDTTRSYFEVFESELLRANVINRFFAYDAEKRDFGYAFDQIKLLLPFNISHFDKNELVKIIHMFPFVNNVNEDVVEKTEKVIKYIFDIDSDLSVKTKTGIVKSKDDNSYSTLGSSRLGWDLCLGDEIVCNRTVASLRLYKQVGTTQLEKMKIIAEWILPLYYEVEINVDQTINVEVELGNESIKLGQFKL